jgi:ribosomal protein S18 acetylase RimI-like enzyme
VVSEVAVVSVGLDRLDELVEFWKLLHRHQGAAVVEVPGLEVLSEPASAEIVRELYREILSTPDAFALFAEDEGRPVGYLIAFFEPPHFMWETGRIGHIDSFYVLPETRGRGVGRALMDEAYREMRRAGASTVALEVVAGNEVAQRFYERDGFATTFMQMHRRLDP